MENEAPEVIATGGENPLADLYDDEKWFARYRAALKGGLRRMTREQLAEIAVQYLTTSPTSASDARLRLLATRLARVWEGFRDESANGVVCSIPDEGLDEKPSRRWCARCQRRYRELSGISAELSALASAGAPDAVARSVEAGTE